MFGKSCYVCIAKTVNIIHTTTKPTDTHPHTQTYTHRNKYKTKTFILTNAGVEKKRVEIKETLTIPMKTNLSISNKFQYIV